MRTALAASAALLAAVAGASVPPPPVTTMAAVAYRVPEAQVEAAADAMSRHMGVDREDLALALGVLARCGKEGAVEFRDLVPAVTATAPEWRRTFGDGPILFDAKGPVGGEAERSERRHRGLGNVERLCTAFENARRGYGGTPEAVAGVREVIAGGDDASRVARTLMTGIRTDPAGVEDLIADDYRERVKRG